MLAACAQADLRSAHEVVTEINFGFLVVTPNIVQDLAPQVGQPTRRSREISMFTSIGLPQFAVIVVVLIIFIIYTQRHRF
jgi:hypothetical protein